MKHLLIIALVVLFTGLVQAQPEPRPDDPRFERIQAAKEAFILEELSLTDAEADEFLPLYRRYDEQLRRYRRKFMEGRRPRPGQAPLSEEEARKRLRANRQKRTEMVALHNEAEAAYLRVLPATKVLRLEEVERAFREELLGRLRRAGGRRPGGRYR